MELSWWMRTASNDLVLVLVVVTVILAAGSAEPLTGANVCHRIENYTETTTETYQEPVRVQTSSWCLAMPPRCWRTRIELRTRYKIKEEIKQRNITECCKGYTVQKLLVNGVSIETCVWILDCKPGFIGKNCDIECPEGSWGILCMYTCDCPPNRICNPINGTCDCPPGFKGHDCSEKCDSGKYGTNCSQNCQCGRDNGNCHHVSGSCTNFTKSIIVTTTNWTLYAPIKISTTANPSGILSSIEPIDKIASTKIKTDYNSETKSKSRNSNEIGLDSTVETAIITEYHETNLPSEEMDSTITTTTRPIVAVVHVGKTSHENIVVTPELNNSDRTPGHNALPLSLDVAVVIVIGSILSLGLTTLAVLALLHIRTKLFETIRLSIYDAEKPDGGGTLSRTKESSNVRTINRSSTITSCDYETPRCIIPQRPGTLPRPSSEMTRESTYSNQYPNIQLFNSLRELMEAHYDRPPAVSTFHRASNETEGEHLYDEIPLQSTNFENKKIDLLTIN